ncbi:hypothetical protein JCM8097_009544 [Rhodosporidiobolus ruineniae]
MTSRRPPPCLTVRIPGKSALRPHNTSQSSVLGISTYSHRYPRRPSQESLGSNSGGGPSSRRSSTDSASSGDLDAAAVALAQVGSRAPSRLLVHPCSQTSAASAAASSAGQSISIAVDVQPPTPDPSALPVSASSSPSTRRRSRSADDPNLRALMQSRRVASIYYVASSAADGNGENGRDSFYLHPDLSGASGLSLDQVPRTVSLEDVTTQSMVATTRSTTGHAVETGTRARTLSSPSSVYSTPPASSPSSAHPPSLAPSTLPFAVYAAPPAHQPYPSVASLPSYPSLPGPNPPSNPSRFREVLGAGPGGPPETEADHLKRLYLCPWEGSSPSKPVAAGRRGSLMRRSKVVGVGAALSQGARDPEKGGWVEEVEHAERVQPSKAEQQRRKLLVTLALVLLGSAIFADLLVLNVRVFAGRDAYLRE